MKNFSIIFAALVIILATACQKDDLAPSKSNIKNKVIDCKKCEGGWDLTDTIP